MEKDSPRQFTPALGKSALTGDYDDVIAVMVREKRLRSRLLDLLAPKAGDTIVDIGSGTGTMAIAIKHAAPGARVVAIDPDPEVRRLAEAKAAIAQAQVEFVTAMGDEDIAEVPPASADKVTSTLVLHQCPEGMKRAILGNAYRLLKPGGQLFIADYGVQSSFLMKMLFNQVRALDGYENTRANKDGMIPLLIAECGFERVEELAAIATPTGSISIHRAVRPGQL